MIKFFFGKLLVGDNHAKKINGIKIPHKGSLSDFDNSTHALINYIVHPGN